MRVVSKEHSRELRAVQVRRKEQNKNSTEIPYPSEFSEVEIQSYVLSYLIENKVDARAEVSSRDRLSRFDIVVFYKRVPKIIIEVKKNKAQLILAQKSRYEKYGLKMDLIRGMKEAKKYCDGIMKRFTKFIQLPEDIITSKVKVTKEGQSCRKCSTPVIKKQGGMSPRRTGQKYYFKFYLKCPKCHTMYMQNDQKVFLTKGTI